MNVMLPTARKLPLIAILGVAAATMPSAAQGQQSASPERRKKAAATVLDFYDTLPRLGNRVWTAKDAEQWMRTFADTGFDVLYLRMSNGRAYWPSKVLLTYTEDGHVAWGANLVKSIHDRDLLQEFVSLAHKHGKKAVYWLPIYDDETTIINNVADPAKAKKYGLYPFQSRMGRDRPDLQWEHRDAWKSPGKSDLLAPGVRRWWGGCLSYLYPEARKYRLDLCRELVEKYNVDGVAYSLRTHSMSPGWPKAVKDYGFNQAVVDEYKKRHGVDIRTQRFDRVKWAMLRGEGLSTLVRETFEYLDGQGKEFHMMVTPGPFAGFGDYSYMKEQKHLLWGSVHCDFETWAAKGWMHTAMLYGTMPRDEFTPEWQAEVAGWKRLLGPRKIPLYFFYRLLGSDSAATQLARFELDNMYNDANIDGLIMYEADNFWPFAGKENPLHELLREYFTGRVARVTRKTYASGTKFPLGMFGKPLGAEGKVTVRIDDPLDDALWAVLDLTMEDVDERKEVAIFINDKGPFSPPRTILSPEAPRSARMPISPAHLKVGENVFRFRFADNLGGTTGGFDVNAVSATVAYRAPAGQ